jgi:flagellar biosynthesis chaperone FliJ
MHRAILRLTTAAAIAVSLGFVWTVGQSGLQQTNRNLCELWASLPLWRYEQCEFQNILVLLWLAAAITAAMYLLIEAFQLSFVRRYVTIGAAAIKDNIRHYRYPHRLYLQVESVSQILGSKVIFAWILVIGGTCSLFIGAVLLAVSKVAAPQGTVVFSNSSSPVPPLPQATSNSTPLQAPLAVGSTKPRPRYDQTDRENMRTALRRLRDLHDKELEPARISLSKIVQIWNGIIRQKSAADISDELKPARDVIRESAKELDQILYQYRDYDDELRPIVFPTAENLCHTMDSALSMLIDDLDELAKAQNVNVAKWIAPRYQEMADRLSKFDGWVGSMDSIVTRRSKELREQ